MLFLSGFSVVPIFTRLWRNGFVIGVVQWLATVLAFCWARLLTQPLRHCIPALLCFSALTGVAVAASPGCTYVNSGVMNYSGPPSTAGLLLTTQVFYAGDEIRFAYTSNPAKAGAVLQILYTNILPATILGATVTNATNTSYVINGTIAATGSALLQAAHVDATAALSQSNRVTVSLTCNPAPAPTTLAVSGPSQSFFGQPVQFQASASSIGGTPTGDVVFSIGGVQQSPVALTNGVATLSRSDLPVGTYAVTANYLGNANFGGASGTLAGGHGVALAATTTTVALNPTPSAYGQSVTLTAQVSATAPSVSTPTGTVVFSIDGVDQPAVALQAGTATFTTTALAAGTRSIIAKYSGSSGHAASVSSPAYRSVTPAATTTTLSLSPNPSTFGQAGTITATVEASQITPVGTVVFTVDGVAYAPVSLVSGKASIAMPPLGVGTHAVLATYHPTSNFTGSNTSASQQVDQAATTVQVTGPGAVVYGQQATFGATVTSAGGTPTGTVTFKIDGVAQTPVPVVGGAASFTALNLSGGGHVVEAHYGGSTNFKSGDGVLSGGQVVSPASTTTTLTMGSASSQFGDTPTAVARVSSVAGAPGGRVVFSIDGVPGPDAPLVGGEATVLLSGLAIGDRSITAAYQVSDSFSASVSGAVAHTVSKATSSVLLTATPEPTVTGQAVTFTARASTPGGPATGSIIFTIDNQQVLPGVTLVNGEATLTRSSLAVGNHTVSAAYSGSATALSATCSLPGGHTVGRAATTTTISSNAASGAFGAAAVFTAHVEALAPGVGTPTGSVTFSLNGAQQPPQNLVNGTAVLSLPSLAVNTYTVTAVYSGDAGFIQSTDTLASGYQLRPADTALNLTVSPEPSRFKDEVTLRAEVTSLGGVPTGDVTFMADGQSLGSAELHAGVALAKTTTLAVGQRQITASYAATTSFSASPVASVQHQVNKALTSTEVTTSAPSITLGGTVTFSVKVNSTAATPTGTVDVYIDNTLVADDVLLTAGMTSVSATPSSVGTHVIRVEYSGDADLEQSTGILAGDLHIDRALVSLSVSASANAVAYGQSATLSADISSAGGPLSGDIVFDINGTRYQAPITNGRAELTVPTLEPGFYLVTASYAQTSDFQSATAPLAGGLTIQRAPSALTVVSSSPVSVYGASPTIEARLNTGSLAPTGTISFTVDGSPRSADSFANGVAVLSLSGLDVGNHTISASYSGDGHILPATDALTGGHTVTPASTVMALSATPLTAELGTAVELVAEVTGVRTPSGNVVFMVDGTSYGARSLVGGKARLTLSALTVGSHDVSASYATQNNHDTSSATLATPVVITHKTTTLGISGPPAPLHVGELATFRADLTAGAFTPTGTVDFIIDGDISAPLRRPLVNGSATLDYAFMSGGNHTVEAVYAGTHEYGPARDALAGGQVVVAAATSTALSLPAAPLRFGDPITATAVVTALTAGAGTPSGIVEFLVNGTVVGTSALVGGSADFDLPALSAGQYVVIARYVAGRDYGASFDERIGVTIERAIPSVALVVSPSPATAGQPVVFGLTVAAPGLVPPSDVTFSAPGMSPATVQTNASGKASYSTAFPSAGSFTVAADFSGTSDISPASASAVLVVDPAPISVTLVSHVPPGEVGADYFGSVTAVGGTGPYFVKHGTGFPPGLQMDAATGQITGRPLSAGSYTFDVDVLDANDQPVTTGSYSITIVVPVAVLITSSLPPSGVAGILYQSVAPTVTGGAGAYLFALSGAPSGISVDATTGIVAGTTRQTGTFNLVLTATDTNGVVGSRNYPVTFTAPVIAASANMPAGEVGVAYPGGSITASGGAEPYTYAIGADPLPPGLVLDADTGAVTGIPSAAGTYPVTFTVTDANGFSGQASASFVTTVVPVVTLPASLPPAREGQHYLQSIAAVGATGPYTYSVSAGSLPLDLQLDTTTGLLSGIPSQSGTADFTITATDSSLPVPRVGTQRYTFAIDAASVLTMTPPPAVVAGAAYSHAFNATGGSGSYTYQIASGTLPQGLQFDPQTGLVSGTTTDVGSHALIVAATDTGSGNVSSQGFALVVVPRSVVVSISGTSAAFGAAFSANLTATGGQGTYTFTSPDKPAWLFLTAAGDLTGTPDTAGSVSFDVEAKDANGFIGTAVITLVVAPPVLSLGVLSDTAHETTRPYSATFSIAGGVAPYSVVLKGGTLPPGLTLGATGTVQGTLSGTPSLVGTYTFDIEARDANGFTVEQGYTIIISSHLGTAILNPTLPTWIAGEPGSGTAGVTNGGGSFTYVSSDLPVGLSLDPVTGDISGTLTTAVTYTFTVTATNTLTGLENSQNYSLSVVPPTFTSASALATGTAGTSYSAQIAVSGGSGIYTFGAATGLPTGLSFDTATGTLSGTPTEAGAFSIVVSIRDSNGFNSTATYALQVDAPTITLAGGSLTDTILASPFAPYQFAASGNGAGVLKFSLSAGTLPQGLALAEDGTLSGSATAQGNFSFEITATDANGFTGSALFDLTVLSNESGALSFSGALADWPFKQLDTRSVAASGTPVAIVSYSVTAGALPPGVSLAPTTGMLSGTPTAAGPFRFEITVKDGDYFKSHTFDLNVAPPGLSLSGSVPLSGRVGVPYTADADATSTLSGSSFVYRLINAPPGLSIDASGAITGTPTTDGSFTFTIQATDGDGFSVSQGHTLVVSEAFIPLALPASLPDAENGVPYSELVQPTNGTGPFTFQIDAAPDLPPNLSIDNTSGLLFGTPSADGQFSFTITATDNLGNSGSKTYTLTIAPAGASTPSVTTVNLTPSSSSPVVGERVVLSAEVLSSGGIPGGTLVFKSNGATIGSELLDAQGRAEIEWPIGLASQTVEAEYLGASGFLGSSSAQLTVSATAAATEASISGNLSISRHDDRLVVVASVGRLAPSSGPVSAGTLKFYLDNAPIDSGPAVGGTRTLISTLDPGLHILRAEFEPDDPALDLGASAEVNITVSADTVVTVTGPASAMEGATSTFVATVDLVPAHALDAIGDVEFFAGTTKLGEETLVGGEATFSTDELPVGTHDIWVNYPLHHVFRASTSPRMAHRVMHVSTVSEDSFTDLSLSTASPVISQMITMRAEITALSGLIPTGDVEFVAQPSGTVLGRSAVDAIGVASLDYAFFDLDTRNIEARYLGEGNFNASSDTSPVVPVSAPTKLNLSASAPRTLVGETVTLTAEVERQAPASGLPSSATIEFLADGSVIGTSVTNGASSATFVTPPLAADTAFTARYLGPLNLIDAASQSAVLNQPVVRDDVDLAVDATNNGTDFVIDVTLTPVALTGRTPIRTLKLRHADGLFADQVITLAGPTAQFSVPETLFGPGVHTLLVSYDGDTYFNAASAQINHQVMGDTTVSFTISPNRPVPGALATLSARVFSLSGSGMPTGSVLFRFASSTWSDQVSANLVGDHATASMVFPDATEGDMTVIYSGDAVYQSNAAAPLRRRIVMMSGLEATSTALSTSAAAVGVGQPVTFTAAVQTPTGSPSGSVVFYSGNILLGRATLGGGLAQYTVPGFASGTHSIIAYYGGTALHAASQSPALSQRVIGADGVSFSMSTRPEAFVALGQRIEVIYTLVATGGVDLTGLGVSSAAMAVACPSDSLAAFATMVCTGSYTITEADMQAGRVDLPGTAVVDGIGAIVSGTSITLQATAVAEQFATMTEEFMTTRQKLVATALRLPDIFDRRRIAPGRRPGTVIARADGTSQILGFTSSLADVMSWGAAKAAENLATSVALEPLPVNIWIDAQMTLHAQAGVDTHWGDFSTLAIGVDYLLGDTALLGAVLQGDWMHDNSSKGSVSGTGYLAGIYGSVALSEHLSLDGSLLYGQSQNEAVAEMFGQYFAGSFGTERFLANLDLSGFWEHDALTIRPSVLMTLSSEDGGDYLVRNETGDAVLVEIERQTEFKLGLGSAFEYGIDLEGGHVLTPKAEIELGLSGSVLGDLSVDSRLYGRSTVGFGYSSPNGLTLNGELGADLDATGFRSVTVRGGIGAKF
ncbi:Ig-like domain repeat protein [Devosia sp. BK]|uniref:Ig-like domain repeat protein n=1 Tax=Devosia sp. BK TaxID=2871706 RepID=UPI002939FB00|nr:Ig-like domain repeat protein [Devosia sp. BK]MDV3252792.1 Ig-like domain repeat protein [Devosia sp. BK]